MLTSAYSWLLAEAKVQLTHFLKTSHNTFHTVNLLLRERRQCRLSNVVPIEVHEIATLEVLPVCQEHDGTMMNILNKTDEGVTVVSVSCILETR